MEAPAAATGAVVGPPKRAAPTGGRRHHGIITAGEGEAAACPSAAGHVDEELKDRHEENDELALLDIPLATSPTAGAGAAVPMMAPPPRPPLQYRGVTIAAAAAKGDLPQVVLLWGIAAAEGINTMLPDADGNTPLHHAALAESSEVAAFLLQQTGGVLPGITTRGAGPDPTAQPAPLVHLRNADGETPLVLAAGAGHLQTLRFLLGQGSDITAADANGHTVFHNAARAGRVWALYFLHAAAVRRLGPAAARALLQQEDEEGHTCLDWAAVMGHLPAVKLLIRMGLDPRHRDAKGRCALHLAARGCAQMCRYLVGQRGLDPRALLDAEGKDALGHARGNRAVLEALRVRPRALAGDAADTPTRLQPLRPGFLGSYALVSALMWAAPFFLPWYLAALALLLASLLLGAARRGGVTLPSSSSSAITLLAQWARAAEAYPGFWLGTLLGLGNHRRFLLFVLLHFIALGLHLACAAGPWLRRTLLATLPHPVQDASQVLRAICLRPVLPLLLQALFGLATALGLLLLLAEQARGVLANVTTNERLNGQRYSWMARDPRTGRLRSRFDRGWHANVLEFMGGAEQYDRDYMAKFELPGVGGQPQRQGTKQQEPHDRAAVAV